MFWLGLFNLSLFSCRQVASHPFTPSWLSTSIGFRASGGEAEESDQHWYGGSAFPLALTLLLVAETHATARCGKPAGGARLAWCMKTISGQLSGGLWT